MSIVTLREREPDDLPVLWRWLHAEPDAQWKHWDAPYFHEEQPLAPLTFDAFVQQERVSAPHPHRRFIAVDGTLVGTVTRFQEAPNSGGWFDLGIVLYDPATWGGGIGTRALTLWTDLTLRETDAHVLTLTTWSGNERMLRAAQKVGYRECARIRQARLWQGQRYDSVKLDLLRHEWTRGHQDG